jgi:phage terminase large subunit-like protein
LYRRLEADRIVVEVNQGGDMVETVIRQVDPSVPVRAVRAMRGKYLRAEPVAALYEQGRVSHVGTLPELEDEMADFGPDGLSGGGSPDRVDALVWALTDLMLRAPSAPRIRWV